MIAITFQELDMVSEKMTKQIYIMFVMKKKLCRFENYMHV